MEEQTTVKYTFVHTHVVWLGPSPPCKRPPPFCCVHSTSTYFSPSLKVKIHRRYKGELPVGQSAKVIPQQTPCRIHSWKHHMRDNTCVCFAVSSGIRQHGNWQLSQSLGKFTLRPWKIHLCFYYLYIKNENIAISIVICACIIALQRC